MPFLVVCERPGVGRYKCLRYRDSKCPAQNAPRYDNAFMDWHEFSEGEEPEVLTTVSEECAAGRHDDCSGILSSEKHENRLVLCVCWCHKVLESDLPS